MKQASVAKHCHEDNEHATHAARNNLTILLIHNYCLSAVRRWATGNETYVYRLRNCLRHCFTPATSLGFTPLGDGSCPRVYVAWHTTMQLARLMPNIKNKTNNKTHRHVNCNKQNICQTKNIKQKALPPFQAAGLRCSRTVILLAHLRELSFDVRRAFTFQKSQRVVIVAQLLRIRSKRNLLEV